MLHRIRTNDLLRILDTKVTLMASPYLDRPLHSLEDALAALYRRLDETPPTWVIARAEFERRIRLIEEILTAREKKL